MNALLPRFTTVYSPSQNLSVDETLIKFKGRVQFRQFLPLKRSRFGLKGFVVADSATGYVLDTMIYTGKEGPAVSRDLAMRVVLKLVEPYIVGVGKKRDISLWDCEGEQEIPAKGHC